MSAGDSLSPQQFLFHGTRHTFKSGQILEGGKHASQYGYTDDHVYATEHWDEAHAFAEAKPNPKNRPKAVPRVYEVRAVEGHPVEPDPGEPEIGAWRSRRFQVIRKVD